MRAWVVVATAAVFYTQASAWADFGEKLSSPRPTDLPRSSSKSSSDLSKEHLNPVKREKEPVEVDPSNSLETSKVPKIGGQTHRFTTASPKEPFRQHLESPQNVNSLKSFYNDNPFAAFYEAARNAYVESSRNNIYSHPPPTLQQPANPYNNFPSRPEPYVDPVGTHFLAQPPPYIQSPSSFYQPKPNNRLPQPFQNSKLHETTYVGIDAAATGQNNVDDYDDGSYDPYKYGDYIYFDDDFSQNSQNPLGAPADVPTLNQQEHSFKQNAASQLSNNTLNNNNQYINNHQENVFKQQKPQQQTHQLFTVASTNFQQSKSIKINLNNNLANNHIKSHNQVANNYQQKIVQQPHHETFQSPTVQQQSHLSDHLQNNEAILSNSKDFSESLQDSYSYQVNAAKQFLKEIEEQQEYAKKVLAASKSPASPYVHRQSSYSTGNTDLHYGHNEISPVTTNNIYPLETSHYQQADHLTHSAHQTSEAGSIRYHQNQQTNFENQYRQSASESQQAPSESQYQQAVTQNHPANQLSETNQQSSLKGRKGNSGDPSYAGEEVNLRGNSSKVQNFPPAEPVVLPNGFLADTEEVRLAKIAHLKLVLDALKTVSTYRRHYPKHKVINTL